MKNSLNEAMALAGQNMLLCLNKDCHYLPYWLLEVSEDYRAHFHFYRSVHNIGRWWDCLLRLEQATGFMIPAELEAKMLDNFQMYMNNEDHLATEPEEIVTDRDIRFDVHSIRETLMALCALIEHRNSIWAKETAYEVVRAADRLVCEDGSLDFGCLHYYKDQILSEDYLNWETPIHSHGRIIEPLVYYYKLTGDELAYQLAERLAHWHFENSTTSTGTLAGLKKINHAHSYLGTLRGLLLFGKLSGQHKYVERVRRCYDQAVMREMIKDSGFSAHDVGADASPEPATAGDAAQLALWLALEGYPVYLDDAEKLIRCRLLPSMVWKTPPILPDGEGNEDRYADLSLRILGAFGGVQTKPHGGKRSTIDVTASCLHTLTDIYNHIVVREQNITRVFFHFDYTDNDITVRSVRENGRAIITIESSRPGVLMVRVPNWTPSESLRVTYNAEQVDIPVKDGFVTVPSGQVVVSFDLPVREIIERTDGTDYRIRFSGDEITGILPNTTFYPFYPDL